MLVYQRLPPIDSPSARRTTRSSAAREGPGSPRSDGDSPERIEHGNSPTNSIGI